MLGAADRFGCKAHVTSATANTSIMLLTWTACALTAFALTALPGAECSRSGASYEHARHRREWANVASMLAACQKPFLLGCSSCFFLGQSVVCASALPLTDNLL